MLRDKTIVLGVTGSIAAYKAVNLLRELVEAGATVQPVLTASATRFVASLTFSALAGRRSIADMWSQAEAGEIGHVEMAHRTDAVLVAPCTADCVARLAAGRADDALSALCLATGAPLVLAPAMETGMWQNEATQANVERLRARGTRIVPPATGALASGREGEGRLAEADDILEALYQSLTPQDLTGENVLVTAGATREAFDPVRFLSNPSSGKMGYAVARVAKRRGAQVTLVSGPSGQSAPPGIERVSVQTTEQMLAACRAHVESATVLVMAAAPADYKPASFSPAKLKKSDQPTGMQVTLDATPDILRELSPRAQRRVVVGFAAESHHVTTNARSKLEAKNLDLIVANDVTHPEAGFGVDTNVAIILDRRGEARELPLMTKEELAGEVMDRVVALLADRG